MLDCKFLRGFKCIKKSKKYSKIESAIVLAKMTMDADPPPYLLDDNFGISPLTIMVGMILLKIPN